MTEHKDTNKNNGLYPRASRERVGTRSRISLIDILNPIEKDRFEARTVEKD